jgi:hypothetical protein
MTETHQTQEHSQSRTSKLEEQPDPAQDNSVVVCMHELYAKLLNSFTSRDSALPKLSLSLGISFIMRHRIRSMAGQSKPQYGRIVPTRVMQCIHIPRAFGGTRPYLQRGPNFCPHFANPIWSHHSGFPYLLLCL